MEPERKRMKGTAIDQSSLEPFYVGGFVDSKSWGKRFHELACTGAVDGHPTRWSPKDFQCIEKIGKGHFGTVFHATTTSHTEEAPCREVALKRISKRVVVDDAGRQRSRCLDLLRSEIFIHSSIHHHNVLRFLGFYEDPENFYFVLPLAPHGDLYQWLDGNRRLRELVAPKVVACVSEALDHLHSHRIAHRDIKPENVLVFGPDHFCLSDFGWACMGSMDRATLCGTPEFLAPEVLDAPRYYYDAVSADMWSLGVLTYELFYHRSPFYCEATRDEDDSCYDGNDSHGRVDAIYAKIRNFHEPLITPRVPTVDESFGPLVRDFCSQLLRVSPADRMPASLAARHPLLRFGPTHHGSSTDADAAATTPPPSLSWHATSTAAVSASPTCHERGDRLTRYFTPGEKRW